VNQLSAQKRSMLDIPKQKIKKKRGAWKRSSKTPSVNAGRCRKPCDKVRRTELQPRNVKRTKAARGNT